MSFFKKLCCCKGTISAPGEDFTKVLGDDLELNDFGKRGAYGSTNEIMSTPIRTELRKYLFASEVMSLNRFDKTKENEEKYKESDFDENKDDEDDHIDTELREKENEYIQKKNSIYKLFDVQTAMKKKNKNKIKMSEERITNTHRWTLNVEGRIEVYTKSAIKIEYNLGNLDVMKVAWGFDHLLVLTEGGNVFVWGNNQLGQLNFNPDKIQEISSLIHHEALSNAYEVLDIGWGSLHSVFYAKEKETIKKEKRILTWGYEGCLGVNDVNENDYNLQSVVFPDLANLEDIKFLICKFNSSAILDVDGNFYYWGDDFDGFRERTPEKKDIFKYKIADISFGFRHAVVLLENGDVYTWGDGTYGEISKDSKLLESTDPIKINYFKKNNIEIIKVEAGERHSLFLDNKGNVYGCGLTKKDNNETERVYAPIKLDDISDLDIIDIFWGESTSYAIDSNGIPYKWEGIKGDFEVISDANGRYIYQVAVGNNNIVILT